MRHLRSLRLLLPIALLAVAFGLVTVARAATPQIPVVDETAFCDGLPVAPLDGVLELSGDCVLDLQIAWIRGMKTADVELSADGGLTWTSPVLPLMFPPVAAGRTSGVAFGPCDVVPSSGTFLFRAHGFFSPVRQAPVVSAPFPDGVSVTCPD